MDDEKILDLYWSRSEEAISLTAANYGGYCYTIAYHILSNPEDAEESVNDTYLSAWNSIPPKRPAVLSAFLGRITRYISLDRWKNSTRLKRGSGEVPLCLDELEECVSTGESTEDFVSRKELLHRINQELSKLSEIERRVFVCRYWYMDSVDDIAKRFGFTHSKTASMLRRTRAKLRKALQKEVVS